MQLPVYLDYHATTPVDPLVLEAMLPYFTARFGNAASRSHSFGWQADEAVSIARQQIADLLQVVPDAIHFTSGSTEGLNMLLKGLAEANAQMGKHIVCISTEHRAVLDTLQWLGSRGFEISILPVSLEGLIDVDQFRDALGSDTIFATAMWANNETGVIQDMAALGAICREKGIPFIADATQAVGKITVHPLHVNVDMLSLSGHKMYGPKGIGAVYINPALKRKPIALLHGGGHERGYRSGTLNVPGIVGLGVAASLAVTNMESDRAQMQSMRDRFEQTIISQLEEVTINGSVANRLYTVSNLRFTWTDSQSIMTAFRNKLAISAGSACSAADPSPSHVLLAMGLSEAQAKASLRISLGRPTTLSDIETAAGLIIDAVKVYREKSPAWQMFKQGLLSDEAERQ